MLRENCKRHLQGHHASEWTEFERRVSSRERPDAALVAKELIEAAAAKHRASSSKILSWVQSTSFVQGRESLLQGIYLLAWIARKGSSFNALEELFLRAYFGERRMAPPPSRYLLAGRLLG